METEAAGFVAFATEVVVYGYGDCFWFGVLVEGGDYGGGYYEEDDGCCCEGTDFWEELEECHGVDGWRVSE